MTYETDGSSAQAELEAEARRAQVRLTLDELRDRMTPGQIVDEAWQFMRGSGGGDYVRNLGTSMRDNPLPVALIGAGIAWLMSGRNGGLPTRRRGREDYMSDWNEDYPDMSRSRHFDRGVPAPAIRPGTYTGAEGPEGDGAGSSLLGKAHSAVDGARDALSDAGRSVVDAAGRTMNSVSNTANSLSDTAGRSMDNLSDTAGRARDGMARARDYAGDRASEFGEVATRRARDLGNNAWETGRYAQERAKSFAEEQPVLLAVAGLGLGAALGAALKATSTETRLMGDASARIKEQAAQLAEEGLNQAGAAATRTFEAVKEEAKDQGLTTADALNVAGTLTERVKKVAEKGKAKLKEEIAAAGDDAADTSSRTGPV